ncbi:MAG TPA: alpha/beta hydrolase [Crenotrichaceae bacterium]|nr:alpha/beta hydrolase [Crenotrichaceae bacterium]
MDTNQDIVLIRGLIREARHWGDFTSVLSQQFPNATIHTPEIPGNGRLHYLTSPTTIAGMTEILRDQVSARKQLNLIGISMGGMIAIDWMSRYSTEVKTAVLINTSIRSVSPFYQRLRWQSYPAIIKILLLPKSQREQEILALTSNQHTHDDEVLNSWLQWQQQYPVSARSAGNQLLAANRFTIINKPTQPILIITSTADRLVDYRCSLKLCNIWQTMYRQHNSAGHDLSLDAPDWLANQISNWLSSIQS